VYGEKSGGNQAQASRTFFPIDSHRSHLIPIAGNDDKYKMLSTRELISDSVFKDFTGGQSRGHSLPGMYQNSRLPEGKFRCSRNPIVCIV